MLTGAVRRIVGARATSVRRSLASVARAEPVWFAAVGATLIGSLAALAVPLVSRGDVDRAGLLLGVLAVAMAQLLVFRRRDTRLLRLLGLRPARVRLAEALVWTAPFTLTSAVLAGRIGLASVVIVAAVALAGIGADPHTTPRAVRWSPRGVPSLLPEWIVGLRRHGLVLAIVTVAGMLSAGSPGAVILTSTVLVLVVSSFFWRPAEGWMLLNAHGVPAGRLLRRKLLWSGAGMVLLVLPVILPASIIHPEHGIVYGLAVAAGLHAHAAGVLVKYAAYSEGQPLDASGQLVWFLTTVSVILPPLALLLLLWLFRRAAARIAPFCAHTQRTHRAP